jgi:hypothetical protein
MSHKNVTKVVYFSSVEFFKQHNVYGFNEQRTENRIQRTEGPHYLPFFPSVI